MRPWVRALPVAGTIAAIGLAVAEWTVAPRGGGAVLGLALLGLFAPAGLLAGGVVAAALGGAARMLPELGPNLVALWRRTGAHPPDIEADRRAAGWVLGAAAALTLPGAAVAVVHLAVSQYFAVQAFAAMLLGLVAVVAGASAVAAAPALAFAAREAVRLFPPGWALRGALGLLGAGVAAAAALLVARVGLGARILAAPGEGLAFAALAGALAWALGRSRAQGGRAGTALLAAAAALALGAHVGAAYALPRAPGARLALTGGAPAGAKLLALTNRLYDRDGDGYASLWLGGDCGEGNPAVHPGASEVACNGVDENCMGGDLCKAEGAGRAGTAGPGTGTPSAGPGTGLGSAPAGPAPAVDARAGLPAGFPAHPNFLLVTIDTLRADHVGYAGYARPTTPRIDAFAASAARFMRAYAQAPNTPRSFPSFLCGRMPGGIAWQEGALNFPAVLPENQTVFEVLAAAGYYNTGAFQHYYFTRDRGFAKGFAAWDDEGALDLKDSNTDSPAPSVAAKVTRALESLRGRREPWVVWTHFFEPHGKYMDHDGSPSFGTSWLDKYDGEIAYADRYVGTVLDALEKSGLAGNTVVVLFSDHGEGFLEHGFSFHGQSLYEEVLRVPLLVRVPGLAARAVDEPVRLIDVAPTLLELASTPPLDRAQGRSLVPLLVGRPDAARTVPAEMLPAPAWPHAAKALIVGGWKVIHHVDEGAWELYDLGTDPGEKTNVFDARPAEAAKMRALMEDWLETGEPPLVP
ncbi:MAG TPA: sulfatase-like hydrolase/transferase [Myxococcota bacterium]|jgi:arylsulfatase A-like enzyme|nr:sulfatase-like hydrolase/transferase [Myxococcota bacterium]